MDKPGLARQRAARGRQLIRRLGPDGPVAPLRGVYGPLILDPVARDRSPGPRPRPRPRPDAADTVRPAATPPEGVTQAGFGPTSASGASAPPHALFTPAASGGVGAGGVPGPDGSAPGPEFTIKGNADSMLFHTPESPYFERTRAEVWFRTADEAVAAGFTEWRPHRRTS